MEKPKRQYKTRRYSNQNMKSERTTLQIWEVPTELKIRYKMACAREQKTIRETILEHLEQVAAKLDVK
jgi:hypothetical protein